MCKKIIQYYSKIFSTVFTYVVHNNIFFLYNLSAQEKK